VWFLLVLLPALAVRHPAGCFIVMDNASIHRPAILRALLAGTNHRLVLLPAYSPEKNPVRPCRVSRSMRPQAHATAMWRRLSCCFRG
jgi:transposase